MTARMLPVWSMGWVSAGGVSEPCGDGIGRPGRIFRDLQRVRQVGVRQRRRHLGRRQHVEDEQCTADDRGPATLPAIRSFLIRSPGCQPRGVTRSAISPSGMAGCHRRCRHLWRAHRSMSGRMTVMTGCMHGRMMRRGRRGRHRRRRHRRRHRRMSGHCGGRRRKLRLDAGLGLLAERPREEAALLATRASSTAAPGCRDRRTWRRGGPPQAPRPCCRDRRRRRDRSARLPDAAMRAAAEPGRLRGTPLPGSSGVSGGRFGSIGWSCGPRGIAGPRLGASGLRRSRHGRGHGCRRRRWQFLLGRDHLRRAFRRQVRDEVERRRLRVNWGVNRSVRLRVDRRGRWG